MNFAQGQALARSGFVSAALRGHQPVHIPAEPARYIQPHQKRKTTRKLPMGVRFGVPRSVTHHTSRDTLPKIGTVKGNKVYFAAHKVYSRTGITWREAWIPLAKYKELRARGAKWRRDRKAKAMGPKIRKKLLAMAVGQTINLPKNEGYWRIIRGGLQEEGQGRWHIKRFKFTCTRIA